jgi:metaxin
MQAYLKFVGIDFDVIPSNNHASPTGALPFLIPALPVGTDTPIPSNKLQKWAIEEVHCEEEQQLNIRLEVYASLLDHRIRNAWVCPDHGCQKDTMLTGAVIRRVFG